VRHRLRERGTRRELEEAAAEEEVNDAKATGEKEESGNNCWTERSLHGVTTWRRITFVARKVQQIARGSKIYV
jgi:hypothetical protein